MITTAYIQTMARYNKWQNTSLYTAAEGIGDAARREDRGAFFGSIHATFSHLVWGDQLWLHRFGFYDDAPTSDLSYSNQLFNDWDELKAEREKTDAAFFVFADKATAQDLSGDLSWYSAAAQREMSRPRDVLVTHIFNHQTHHRGQIHAMLTAAGAKPDDTDIPFMPQ